MPKTERPSRFRLPPDVRPREYDIHLEPDLEAGRFRGEVRLGVGLERARQEIVLHAAELKVERAAASLDGDEVAARVRADAPDQTVALRFPRALPAGEARLVLRFAGRLNEHLRGLYAASPDGRRYPFSQCEAADALRRLEDYFDIPYPYGKLDLVAVPDFEAGAMENAGAVFFRETLLLLDPATASLNERKRAAEVIAHELAHMWYGDLVTMAWWDDLWLNEAF